jgi:hypothetical protein
MLWKIRRFDEAITVLLVTGRGAEDGEHAVDLVR